MSTGIVMLFTSFQLPSPFKVKSVGLKIRALTAATVNPAYVKPRHLKAVSPDFFQVKRVLFIAQGAWVSLGMYSREKGPYLRSLAIAPVVIRAK